MLCGLRVRRPDAMRGLGSGRAWAGWRRRNEIAPPERFLEEPAEARGTAESASTVQRVWRDEFASR